MERLKFIMTGVACWGFSSALGFMLYLLAGSISLPEPARGIQDAGGGIMMGFFIFFCLLIFGGFLCGIQCFLEAMGLRVFGD